MAGTTAVGAGAAVPLGHREAMILAAREFDRIVAQLQALAPRDWAQPTVCELWDVRAPEPRTQQAGFTTPASGPATT
jgi:hypothetical protein